MYVIFISEKKNNTLLRLSKKFNLFYLFTEVQRLGQKQNDNSVILKLFFSKKVKSKKAEKEF